MDFETPLPPKKKIEKPLKQNYYDDLDQIDKQIEEQRKRKMELVRKIKELSNSIE